MVSGPATITGSTVTLTGAGTVVLQASEAADSNYAAATRNATFTVGARHPDHQLHRGEPDLRRRSLRGRATSNSTGAFTYSVVSGPATISGSTVTLTGAGTVVLQASEAADSNYAAATRNATFTVGAGTPTISFTVGNQTYGAAPFAVSATSNSTGAFTYSVVSGPATISGSTVTLTGAGTVVLQASEAADSNYAAATRNATFTVGAGTPTISFTVREPDLRRRSLRGQRHFELHRSLHLLGGLGTRHHLGLDRHPHRRRHRRPPGLRSSRQQLRRRHQERHLHRRCRRPDHQLHRAGTRPTAPLPSRSQRTSNSTGAFTYSVVSGPATITGSTVTLTGAGTVVLQASEAADSNYAAATKNATFTVGAGTPTISFTVGNQT